MLPQISPLQLDYFPMDLSGLPTRYLNAGEIEIIIALVASVRPKGVLEFGCNVGRTAKAILRNVPGIEYYQGVDVPLGYVTAKPVQRNEIPANPGELVADDCRFELLLSRRGSLDFEPDDLRPCDACFIDGDHGREAVMHDSALAYALVRPGGIVCWHDYHDRGNVDVREVLNEFHAAGAALTHVSGTWLVYERIPSEDPKNLESCRAKFHNGAAFTGKPVLP